MPSNWAFIVAYGVVFIFAVYIGFLIGQVVCKRSVVTTRDYWLRNLLGLCLAILITMFVTAFMVNIAIIGLLAGYIVGLKMTFGESTGPWKAIDKFLNINPGHRRTAASGVGEDRRRRRKAGEAAPDLISVSGNQKKDSR